MTRAAVLALAILAGGCLTTPTSPRETFDELIDAYAAAWRGDDAAGVAALLSADAVIMPHHGDTPVTGREAILAHWFPGGSSGIALDVYEFEIADADADEALGFAHGRFRLEFTWDDGGQSKRYANGGNFMMIFRREPGGWKIARYIWNDPIPEVR